MTQPKINLIARCVLTVIVVAGSATTATSVTISPVAGGDDTTRIQHIIDSSTGEVHFAAGVYRLNGASAP